MRRCRISRPRFFDPLIASRETRTSGLPSKLDQTCLHACAVSDFIPVGMAAHANAPADLCKLTVA
eukprot:3822375-Amphidinium_carterae.1